MRRIAVLTSGGDAPGMNAAVRAVVRRALFLGLEPWGVYRGYEGLIDGDMKPFLPSSVADIIHRGGTVLRTARSRRFMEPEGQRAALASARHAGIEGLVVIGGDGSFRGVVALHKQGFPTIGVPASIDNDIYGTDYTIGFDTAVNTATEAINRVRDTALSLERIFVIEVMGRQSGFIALAAGLACGAESILIPEFPADMDQVCRRLTESAQRGKRHSIIVTAEGAHSGPDVAREITTRTGLDTRVTVLGYAQRGGSPTALDAMLAGRMGGAAVDLLLEGRSGVMTGVKGAELVFPDLEDVLRQRPVPDRRLYELALSLAI